MTVPRHPIELRAIDSHTGGEPTRLIVDGFPDLGNGSMAERRQRFAREFDRWRQAVILEPRGNDVLVGALLCKPVSPQATAGVIFFGTPYRLGATVPVPLRTQENAELWVTLEGWDGSVHQASIPLKTASPATVAWLKQQGGKP